MTLPHAKSIKNNRQQTFFKNSSKCHGGDLNHGKRKTKRPLDTRMPIHLVMRSKKAKGHLTLTHYQTEITAKIHRLSKRFQISVYEQNINFNHIHLLIRGKKRVDLQNFFRALAGIIARIVTQASRGNAFGRFWDYLIYTRVLNSWKKDFYGVKTYILQNTKEVLGVIPYKTRKSRKLNTS